MESFNIGDGVHWAAGTDVECGTVIRVSDKSVWVVEDKAILLNGASSDEPDALKFSPGGFCGHTSGTQRYHFEPGEGDPIRFTLRRTGDFKMEGHSIRGSMRSWGILRPGRLKVYDFNF